MRYKKIIFLLCHWLIVSKDFVSAHPFDRQFKFGVKWGFQGSYFPGSPGFSTGGYGYPIAIWGEVCKKIDKTSSMAIGLESGLILYSMHLGGPRKNIDPLMEQKFQCPKNQVRVSYHVQSIVVPLVLKIYYFKGFSMNVGGFLSMLLMASKEDPYAELAKVSKYKEDYAFLRDLTMDPYQLLNCDPDYKKERDDFFAHWEKRKKKAMSLPIRDLDDNRFGMGVILGFSYEFPFGLILNLPVIVSSNQEVGFGGLGLNANIGYNFGKFLRINKS